MANIKMREQIIKTYKGVRESISAWCKAVVRAGQDMIWFDENGKVYRLIEGDYLSFEIIGETIDITIMLDDGKKESVPIPIEVYLNGDGYEYLSRIRENEIRKIERNKAIETIRELKEKYGIE